MATLHSSSESQAQKLIVHSLTQGDYTLSEISTLIPGSSEDPKSIRSPNPASAMGCLERVLGRNRKHLVPFLLPRPMKKD